MTDLLKASLAATLIILSLSPAVNADERGTGRLVVDCNTQQERGCSRR